MRATVLAVAMIFLPAVALGQTTTCDLVAVIAKATISARQSGVPMQQVMKKTESTMKEGALKDVARNIVEDAYTRPDYEVLVNKEQAASEFESSWYLQCYKTVMKK